MLTAQAFQTEIENFLSRTGMAASAFGKAAVGDPSFVKEIREGRTPSLKTAERVIQFIHEQSASAA